LVFRDGIERRFRRLAPPALRSPVRIIVMILPVREAAVGLVQTVHASELAAQVAPLQFAERRLSLGHVALRPEAHLALARLLLTTHDAPPLVIASSGRTSHS